MTEPKRLAKQLRQGLSVIAISALLTAASFSQKSEKEAGKAMQAKGTFEVKLTPQDDKSGDSTRGRILISKQLHGDLEGTSEGQMLTAMTPVKGSAGYVAVEMVSGTLHGRRGSFVLQHSGTMARGAQELTVTVVPDSGTNELAGLSGRMTIRIADGKHFYDFEYKLADASPAQDTAKKPVPENKNTGGSMKIVLTSVMVSDQEKALKFYTEVLGFVKKTDIPVGQYKWLTVVSPEQPDGPELLLEPMGFPPAQTYQKALFDAGIPLTSFAVDDIESTYQRLKKQGVVFRGAPTKTGPVTTAIFEDTCGNLIQIAQN
jgi:catechol 2,3-dioxygenase-like lactoylglutathione lyase family enzyme